MARPVGQFEANKQKLRKIMEELSNKSTCFAKTASLAKRMGCSERTIYRYLASLKKDATIFTNSSRRFSFKHQRYQGVRHVTFYAGSFTILGPNTYSRSLTGGSTVVSPRYVLETRVKEKNHPILAQPTPSITVSNPKVVAPMPPPVTRKRVSLRPTAEELFAISEPEDFFPEGMKFVSEFEKHCWLEYTIKIMDPNRNTSISQSSWEPVVKSLIERTEKELGVK